MKNNSRLYVLRFPMALTATVWNADTRDLFIKKVLKEKRELLRAKTRLYQ